jgi:hypothetical protein
MRLANVNGRQISQNRCAKECGLRLGAVFAQVWVSGGGCGGGHVVAVVSCRAQ